VLIGAHKDLLALVDLLGVAIVNWDHSQRDNALATCPGGKYCGSRPRIWFGESVLIRDTDVGVEGDRYLPGPARIEQHRTAHGHANSLSVRNGLVRELRLMDQPERPRH